MVAFQSGVSAASGAYQDLLTKLVATCTSKYVSSVSISAAGTGYTAGDVVTLPHASGFLPAAIEILTVGGGGTITSLRIRSGGAYANRVASATVNAGGTGYVTGNVVRLTTGTFTQYAKFTVTAAAGAITSVALLETGGAYTVDPTLVASPLNNDVGLGTGTGGTLNVTMAATTPATLAAVGGTGTGGIIGITLTAAGWEALFDRNNYSFNSITNEKEVILRGTVSGGDAPIVGIRSYTATAGDTRYGWILCGADDYNGALSFDLQPNIGPSTVPSSGSAICLLMFNNAQSFWFRVSPRAILPVIKAVGGATTTYMSGYAGLMNPYGTQVESPYPMLLSGTTKSHSRKPDAGGFFCSGLSEMFSDSGAAPGVFRRPSDAAYANVQNVNNGALSQTTVMYPLGNPFAPTGEDLIVSPGQFGVQLNIAGISNASGAASTATLMPWLGTNEIIMIPLNVVTHANSANTAETIPRGEVDAAYWIPGTKPDGSIVAAEDVLIRSGVRYIIFGNAHRTERYSFFAVKEG